MRIRSHTTDSTIGVRIAEILHYTRYFWAFPDCIPPKYGCYVRFSPICRPSSVRKRQKKIVGHRFFPRAAITHFVFQRLYPKQYPFIPNLTLSMDHIVWNSYHLMILILREICDSGRITWCLGCVVEIEFRFSGRVWPGPRAIRIYLHMVCPEPEYI